METLVLNRNYFAIQITGWRRALSLVYADQAAVVDEEYRLYDFETWRALSREIGEHPEGLIRTPTFSIAVPEVILLKGYDRLPPLRVKFTRRNIYEHYDSRCCYCGRRFPTSAINLEHIVPKSRGGRSDWSNVVTACIACNTRKGNRLPDEAGMTLLIKPHRPRWRGPASLFFRPGLRIRASWQKFIDSFYWDGELKE
jgi:5-methylcytosine-specific restriction endonuclease McrA